MRFLPYSPEQAYLLPPSVEEVLGEEHLCFFLHRVVEQLDLSGFEQGYVEEGPPAYAPALMAKVAGEMALAATAYNLTRLWNWKRAAAGR